MFARQNRNVVPEVNELKAKERDPTDVNRWREVSKRAILEASLARAIQVCGRSGSDTVSTRSAVEPYSPAGGNRHNPLNWHLSPVDGILMPGARNNSVNPFRESSELLNQTVL